MEKWAAGLVRLQRHGRSREIRSLSWWFLDRSSKLLKYHPWQKRAGCTVQLGRGRRFWYRCWGTLRRGAFLAVSKVSDHLHSTCAKESWTANWACHFFHSHPFPGSGKPLWSLVFFLQEKPVEEYKVTVTLADGKDSPKSDGAKLPVTMAKLETLTERRPDSGVEATLKRPSNYQLSSAIISHHQPSSAIISYHQLSDNFR